jgi:lactoylglutathione lyase
MNVSRTGIILNTENYAECVSFYKNLFNLPVLFDQKNGDFQLTCFEFDGSYLMIETEGYAVPEGKTVQQGASKLRFNVTDIEAAHRAIKAYGIDAEIIRNDWGSTVNIFDPDGNRIGIRDEATFHQQMDDWQQNH